MQVEKYMVCTDCMLVIANGDYSSLDYHFDEKESKERAESIDKGIDSLIEKGGYLTIGDLETKEDFSIYSCECCGSKLAGERFEAIVIIND
jgi:hypothetical protein